MDDDDLLTPREAARLLGVGVPTLGWWARIGALKSAVRTPGGHRRYRRTDVLAFREAADRDASHSAGGADPERERREQDAVRLYEQGWSIRQVAARFDCGYGAMRRILMRRTTLRPRSGRG
ncbi:helix-turn-helix domain-containing protein [Actinoallomurus sp. NBC_01490]|jgi:excisionase family DNA binding protein|uniref:MerR family transcriptional regulator n=1 Tax=Actinoallomurus sp. NBC_01490 TaxID=2903557 RepID=UPI002E300FF7|nr:helix-turn-helix domain-containing protein [Actinoallomurus sp. NBC_01490]